MNAIIVLGGFDTPITERQYQRQLRSKWLKLRTYARIKLLARGSKDGLTNLVRVQDSDMN